PLTPSSTRPSNSIVSITSSIHSLLTQPALVTLAQLVTTKLLSGMHSSRFGSSDAFRIFNAYELSQKTNQLKGDHKAGVLKLFINPIRHKLLIDTFQLQSNNSASPPSPYPSLLSLVSGNSSTV
ncbi:hypothetical protein VP01_6217g1, partial [Puccinia sorghi]